MRKKSSIMLVVMLTFLLIVVSASVFDFCSVKATPGWCVKAPLPELLEGAAGAVVEDIIYVLKGHNESIGDTGDVRIYDPATDSWYYGTPSPIVDAEFYQAGVVSNKIYVIGGRHTFTGNEEYDPLLDTWTSKASMPTGRAGHALGVVNFSIYVIGGRNGSTPLEGNVTNVVEAYHPSTDSWTTGLAPMPTARSDTTAAVVNGKIYVIGGWNGSSILSTVEVYDPFTDTWSFGAAMPTPRADLGACGCSGHIHVVGGINATQDGNATQVGTHEIYAPSTDTWSFAEPMPTPRAELVVVNVGGTIYAMGGGIYGESVNANEVYPCVAPGPHDVAVTDVQLSKTIVGQGYCMKINVTVENQGDFLEWFGVVAPYFGGEVIPTPAQWETYWSMGDVNRDGYIDDVDWDLFNASFIEYYKTGICDPDCDFDCDGDIDLDDMWILMGNYIGNPVLWTYFGLPVPPRGTQRGAKLYPGNQTTLTFTSNTTYLTKGNHTIKAYADPVPGETDTLDNTYTDGWVIVTWLGDVSSEAEKGVPDFKVDEDDLWYFNTEFIEYYKGEAWDPNCDFNCDGKIDEDDLWLSREGFIEYYK